MKNVLKSIVLVILFLSSGGCASSRELLDLQEDFNGKTHQLDIRILELRNQLLEEQIIQVKGLKDNRSEIEKIQAQLNELEKIRADILGIRTDVDQLKDDSAENRKKREEALRQLRKKWNEINNVSTPIERGDDLQ